ncbi:MopE-related protein [Flavobacterium sp. N1994]|uniref:MopE-related protein n=1 Tax=Flavobacterium sp. N1994 TaxID=2986827 RepID=UPI0022230876|nr:T9SS type A sorting domain-containing protein [Flavobacterium sp. N1994]
MKKLLLYLVLLTPLFSFSQVFREWTGSGNNWSTTSNWTSGGITYAQLEWKGNGLATSNNDAGNPFSAWRLFFTGAKSYTITGNPVSLFDFSTNNSWVLSQSTVAQTINNTVNFYDAGSRTSWITTQNSGSLTFGGAIDIGGGVTALRIAGSNTSGTITINGNITGTSKPIDIGTDELGNVQTNTRVFFNGTNSYSGPTTIYGGTLSISNNAALGTAGLNVGNGANTSTFAVTGTTTRTQNINIIDNSSAGVIDVSSGQSFTLSGNLTGGANNGTKYGKDGSGTLVVNGSSNTYNGQIQIGNGTVRVQTGLGTNTSTSNRGVDLGLNVGDVATTNNVNLQAINGVTVGHSIYVAPNTSGATRTISLSGSGSCTFNNEIYLGGNVTFDGGSGTLNLTGNIINTSGVIVNGGTVVYSGNNKTYTGATNVTAGTLSVVKSGYTATITTSGLSVAFSPAPARGNYTILPGALSSASTLSTTGLGAGQTASFNASTGVLTVNDTPTVSLVSNDADNTFCLGTSVTFTATAANVGGGTVSYNFKVNGSSVQSSSSNVYTTTGITNGQAVTVDITVTGGTFLSSTTATSNSISNTVQSPPASAGSNGTLTICSTTTLTTGLLFGALTGSPAIGGTWSPAPAGAGTYTYTQAAISPCSGNNTATVVVTVQPAPASAGTNGTLTVCAGTTPSNAQLFAALGGSPAAGGTWSNVGLVYTYTQAATSPCTVNNTATVTVTEQALPASAGSNGTLTICSTTPLTTGLLFSALTGSPAAGGTWSPALAGAGTYTYTQAATSPCTVNNTATVVVTVQPAPASAGTNGTLTVCAGTTPSNAQLFAALGGSPAAGGTWSNIGLVYTYTQTAISPCAVNNTATVTVTEQALPASAGSNGTLTICSTTPLTTGLLFGALTGSPAAGGTWSPALSGAGTYTYTQAATSPCTVDNTATVVVTVQPAPASAGSNGTLTICSTTTLTTGLLFGALGGSPAAGGTWSPAPAGAGTYTYTQAATSPCSADNTATVVVTVQPTPASAGSNGTLSICSTTTLTTGLLFGALTGSPAAGGTWSPAPTGAGTYTYTQSATSPCSVNNTATVVVSVVSALTWYQDLDGDGYGNSAVSQVTCSNLAPAYSLLGGDCNDAVATINPGVTEICYNNIDDNCSGAMSEGCAPVVVNMTASYNNTTLLSLSTAIPAVGYTYPGTSNIKYRFSITNVTTNVTSSDIIQASRYVTIPASLHVYGATYTIKVSAVINDEVVPFYGNTITVTGPTVQLITLSSASCGATLASLSSTISANGGLNATGYTFRIRLTSDSGPTPTYGFSSSATRFVGANTFAGFPLQYNTSYQVAVKYTYNDPVTSLPVEAPYGAECTVSTPSIPLIGLAAPTCGSQVATMNAGITASPAAYATGYRFRIRLTSDNGPTPTYYYSLPNASRFSSLVAFQGITLAYNTQYSIAVEYSILNNSVTQWSGFGSECIVQTPFFPTTSLVPSQCGLATPTSLTQQLNITPYPGFPNYKVKLDEISGESITNSQEIVITYSNFRLNQFSIAQLGKNYNVSVAIKLNGVFGDYSTACDLFTAAPSRTVKLPFKASAYPNPFANNFMLDVTTSSKSVVGVKVYDMVGRLIEQREVSVTDLENATIGDRYPSGVYNVVVSQEDSIETVRVVKR